MSPLVPLLAALSLGQVPTDAATNTDSPPATQKDVQALAQKVDDLQRQLATERADQAQANRDAMGEMKALREQQEERERVAQEQEQARTERIAAVGEAIEQLQAAAELMRGGFFDVDLATPLATLKQAASDSGLLERRRLQTASEAVVRAQDAIYNRDLFNARLWAEQAISTAEEARAAANNAAARRY